MPEEIPHPDPVLVTGCAGFIGMHLAVRLLEEGRSVLGVDLVTDDYDPGLKRARLDRLRSRERFSFRRVDVRDRSALETLCRDRPPRALVHLAARSGVRSSAGASAEYVSHNVTGSNSVLQVGRAFDLDHVILASSSSVYGDPSETPTPETASTTDPNSVYAATKGASELLGRAHAHLGSLPVTALRLFTVYGPWGRPDMAYFIFARALLREEPVPLFDRGRMERDMTYVDDAVEAIVRLLPLPPSRGDEAVPPGRNEADPSGEHAPYRALNVGSGRRVTVASMLETLESVLGRRGEREHRPPPKEDVPVTQADTDELARLTGFVPETPLREGLDSFADWFRRWRRSDGRRD